MHQNNTNIVHTMKVKTQSLSEIILTAKSKLIFFL